MAALIKINCMADDIHWDPKKIHLFFAVDFSWCRENTHPAGFTLVIGLWTPRLSSDVSVACVCGRVWDGSCLWRRHDLRCVSIGRGRAVPRWSFALFGLEFCDDDSHVIHSDSIVLRCTSVNILQSWPETRRGHAMLTDKNKHISLLVSHKWISVLILWYKCQTLLIKSISPQKITIINVILVRHKLISMLILWWCLCQTLLI